MNGWAIVKGGAGRGRRNRVRRARAFAFRQRANGAQAFGHDAAGGGRNINANVGQNSNLLEAFACLREEAVS